MHTSGKALNAYNKNRGVYVYHLPLKVDEGMSISSQKNRYSPYNLYIQNTNTK